MATKPFIKVDDILEVACEVFGVDMNQLLCSGCKNHEVAKARAVCCKLIRDQGRHSFPEIAEHVGLESHTTVIEATRRVELSDELMIKRTEVELACHRRIERERQAARERADDANDPRGCRALQR